MNAGSTPAPAAAGGALPAYVGDIARSVLMGAGAVLAQRGYVTNAELPAIVGGLVAAISAAWSWMAAHPSSGSPLSGLLAAVRHAPAPDQAAYDAGLTAAEAAALAQATPALNRIIAAHVGLLAGPVQAIADREARAVADEAVDHLKV
jgi:hypothetical protein